jgi:hypothetical protein
MVSDFRQQFSHGTSCNRILARFLFVKSLTKGLNVLCCPFRAVTPFSDDMRPLLLNLRAHFAKIPLPTFFRIQGSYAVRFFVLQVMGPGAESFPGLADDGRRVEGVARH